MTSVRWPWHRWDAPVWQLLGVIELTYHPAVAVAVLAALDAVVSPLPVVALRPFAVSLGGDGVSLVRVLEGVVLVDFLADVVAVYVVGHVRARLPTGGDADE
ncbi:MAG: hypothetical protein ABEI96_09850 [Haloarculaceae archaeon]